MHLINRIVILFCLGAVSSLAVTLPDADELVADYKLLDLDETQSITLEEWEQHAFALFQAADTNENQQLEGVEIDFNSETENTFSRADSNHDGNLDIDEFMKLQRTFFKNRRYQSRRLHQRSGIHNFPFA